MSNNLNDDLVPQTSELNQQQLPLETEQIAEQSIQQNVDEKEIERQPSTSMIAKEKHDIDTNRSDSILSLVSVLPFDQPNLMGTTTYAENFLWQDKSLVTGLLTPSQRSFSWRMDHWSVRGLVHSFGDGPSGWSRLGRHYYDRIQLRDVNRVNLAPFGAGVAMTANLITDPTSARSTVINPVIAAPDLTTLVMNSVQGRKSCEETLWGLRLLAMFNNAEENIPSESRSVYRFIAAGDHSR